MTPMRPLLTIATLLVGVATAAGVEPPAHSKIVLFKRQAWLVYKFVGKLGDVIEFDAPSGDAAGDLSRVHSLSEGLQAAVTSGAEKATDKSSLADILKKKRGAEVVLDDGNGSVKGKIVAVEARTVKGQVRDYLIVTDSGRGIIQVALQDVRRLTFPGQAPQEETLRLPSAQKVRIRVTKNGAAEVVWRVDAVGADFWQAELRGDVSDGASPVRLLVELRNTMTIDWKLGPDARIILVDAAQGKGPDDFQGKKVDADIDATVGAGGTVLIRLPGTYRGVGISLSLTYNHFDGMSERMAAIEAVIRRVFGIDVKLAAPAQTTVAVVTPTPASLPAVRLNVHWRLGKLEFPPGGATVSRDKVGVYRIDLGRSLLRVSSVTSALSYPLLSTGVPDAGESAFWGGNVHPGRTIEWVNGGQVSYWRKRVVTYTVATDVAGLDCKRLRIHRECIDGWISPLGKKTQDGVWEFSYCDAPWVEVSTGRAHENLVVLTAAQLTERFAALTANLEHSAAIQAAFFPMLEMELFGSEAVLRRRLAEFLREAIVQRQTWETQFEDAETLTKGLTTEINSQAKGFPAERPANDYRANPNLNREFLERFDGLKKERASLTAAPTRSMIDWAAFVRAFRYSDSPEAVNDWKRIELLPPPLDGGGP